VSTAVRSVSRGSSTDNEQCERAAAAEVARRGGGSIGFYGPAERLGHPHIFTQALTRADGAWVYILHDSWLEPGFYAALREVFRANPEAGAAFCQQRIAHQGAQRLIDGAIG